MVPVDLRRVVWQREPHAVGHPAVGEELNGLLCASGPIGAHQHFSTGSGAEPGLVRYPAVILTWSAGIPTSRETVGSEATGSEELLVAPQRRKVRQAMASQGHAHHQIRRDLARVVHRPRPPPCSQGPRELVAQARDPARLGQ